jgi:TolB-like protein
MTLFAELRRRNVFRVGAAYLVISWLLLQVVDVVAPILGLPDWIAKLILLIIAIGLIPALLLAWAFEMTPQGVKRERDVDRSVSTTRKTGQKLNRVTIGVLVLIILMMGTERIGLFKATSSTSAQQSAATVPQKPPPPISRPQLSPEEKSIAVLPFSNRSAGSENTQFFSDGIHDDLLTNLSKVHDLKVISRTSVMPYRDTTQNMREIGEELGVTHLLEGGIQQAGDRVRINIQLINAYTDENLWAETYDRTVTAESLFEIQGEVARAIATALQANLTTQESEELERAPTANLEAYRAVLMSRQQVRRDGFISLRKAVEYADKAIELDADYSDAYVALATALNANVYSGVLDVGITREKVQAALDKAFDLDPMNSGAWSALADLKALLGDPDAEEAFAKAMQLDPGNSDIMTTFAGVLQRGGKPREALELLTRARELDPLSISTLFIFARTLGALDDNEGARAAFTRIREIDPSSQLGYGPTAGTYFASGQVDMALYWLRRGQQADPDDFEMGGWMVFAYDTLEDYIGAQEWSTWLNSWVTNQPQPMAMQARHHYLVGNFEIALQYSNLALNLGLPNRWNSDAIFMRIKRDEALANGTPEAGIAVFREHHPQLFQSPPEITADNLLQAVDLALLLKLSGQQEETTTLLEAALAAYEQPYFTSGSQRERLVPAKAEALAILGDEQAALTELRRIIDNGWRLYWRWETNLNPNFNDLHKNTEFQAMVQELEADIAQQRERVMEMTHRGEIAPVPPARGK